MMGYFRIYVRQFLLFGLEDVSCIWVGGERVITALLGLTVSNGWHVSQ